ncbi:tRNA uridine 5-carboxymethylaminomethyl modification protein [Thermococcus siculi]|uniref:tRNA uridine 5-carboxymethylaminomethyl modification protein n=1 Tax=Thermococcus siculi TaxID=72803 RepID=A0A2Z2MM71_9EURY|nr:FAD-dependent oxidoreductase [Thermococcus siculi]ASJ08725.1 tRNA uridine 5-carboxymethylaminomethyl modification protein [Thermococcus siculi]
MKEDYPKLFEPINIGKVELMNRAVFPPISTNFALENGRLTERFVKHYERRARGGVGLIIVENTSIDFPEGKHMPFQPRIDSKAVLKDWEWLAFEVHKYEGVKLSIELAHEGWKKDGVDYLSPEKIEELIEKFAYSARLAMEAGFDMVEIQGAHGLLVNQFLSPLTNHRDDEWGQRTRFAKVVRKRIAEECGRDFPVTIRLAVDDFLEGGINLTMGREIAMELAKAGYDMIQADIGLGPKEKRLEPMHYPQAWRAYLAEKIRPLPVPVAAVGMIREPAVAERVLETQADLVVLGRTLIADPDWVKKVAEGKEHLIRRCIGCSECIKAVHDEKGPIRCGANANVGNEEDIPKAEARKRIAIVGAGPGGLEAARVAALRGHEVHLFYETFGGQLVLAKVPPGKEKIGWLIEYYRNVLAELPNVHLHEGAATKEDILAVKPDAVVIATGAKPFLPCSGERGLITPFDKILTGEVKVENKSVLIGGGGLVGVETAIYLAQFNNRIKIIKRSPAVLPNVERITRGYLLRELEERGIPIIVNRRFVSAGEGYAIVENTETGEKEMIECDVIVGAFGMRPHVPFVIDGVEYHIIGDAKSVRNIASAVKEGYEVGRRL